MEIIWKIPEQYYWWKLYIKGPVHCTLCNTICVTHLPVQAEDKEDEEEKTNQPGEVFSPVKLLIYLI